MESKISIDITDRRWLVSQTHLNMPYSREQVLQELENEEWVPHGMVAPVGHNPWPGTRFKCMRPKWENQALVYISRYYGSDAFKRRIIDWMYEHYQSIDVTWGLTADEMFNKSRTHIEFTKDLPGFVNDIHCDYRQLIATGMVYFSESDNPDLSTYFYETQDRVNPIRMPTNFGDGWWHMNYHNTWHEGWNRTDQVRYSGLLGLTINVADI
jgi:hypothetical protein